MVDQAESVRVRGCPFAAVLLGCARELARPENSLLVLALWVLTDSATGPGQH